MVIVPRLPAESSRSDFLLSSRSIFFDHIAKDAPLVAPAVIERLVRRSIQIGDFPHSGREVPEYQREDVREILERPYRILYRIKPDRIDGITVMHYRQLLPDDLTQI